MLSSLPLAQGGKTKALAVTSIKRVAGGAGHSDRRRVRGIKGFEFVSWYGDLGTEELAGRHRQASCRPTSSRSSSSRDVTQRLLTIGFETRGFDRK